MTTARNVAIILAVALGLTVLPGGGAALQVALTTLTLAFFVAIAFVGHRLYREHRSFTLASLDDRHRAVFYVALGAAVLTFAATPRLFSFGGVGVIAWLALIGASSYAAFWTFARRT